MDGESSEAREGQTAGATPAAAPPSAESNSSAPGEVSQPRVEQPKRAQAALSRDDLDAKAFELLEGGADRATVRKQLAAAQPPADGDSLTGAREKQAQASGQAETREGSGGPEANAYEGLDAKARQALSQTHLLPDAEQWNKWTPAYRAALVNGARETLASRSREFQRQRDSQGRFVPAEQSAAGEQPGDDSQTTPQSGVLRSNAAPPVSQQQPAGTRDVRALQSPPGTAPGSQPQQDVLATFKTFAERVGDDTVTQPFIEGIEQLLKQLGERDQHHAAALSQRDEQLRFVGQTIITQQENNAFVKLSAEIPELDAEKQTDPAQKQAAEQLREQVKENAMILARAAYNTGAKWSWEQCLLSSARMLLTQNVQRNAQQQLAQQRTDTLRSTPGRASAQSQPHRAVSKDDRDALVYQRLQNGESREQVRAALG